MKNALKPRAKRVLILLELTAPASAADAAIKKKNFGSGTTKLVISNEGMVEEFYQAIESEWKEQKGKFLSVLLGALCTSLWGNLLKGKGLKATRRGQGLIRAGEGIIRPGQDS